MKIGSVFSQPQPRKKQQALRDLIRSEAKIGGRLFGSVPKGVRREFFCLDERTWVWHEEWKDQNGMNKNKTTRYEVQSDKVLKVQDGKYYRLDQVEALRLLEAAQLYEKRVRQELYPSLA